jgi:hypothetical protein
MSGYSSSSVFVAASSALEPAQGSNDMFNWSTICAVEFIAVEAATKRVPREDRKKSTVSS